ncbi:MAG: hypothetical protein IJQ33_03680 [Clostridia bacterium]|nr:hypothetical protein [Clostridia bacterium]
MKKTLSLFLVLVMLFTCAFSAVSLAETTGALTEAQQLELATVMEWLLRDISQENYTEIFSWGKDDILQKLEDYDQPLETLTKEEIADQLAPVISMLGLFAGLAESEDGGEAIAGMLGGMLGGLMGGAMGGAMGDADSLFSLGDDWISDFGEDEDEESEEDYEPDYTAYYYDMLWVNGETKLESVYQDEYYKIAITEGDKELAYLCELDAATGIATGIGTGDPDTTEAQPDHGVATFYITEDDQLVWKKADGEEVFFTGYESPLSGLIGYVDGKDVTLVWMGNHLEVIVQQDDDLWVYACPPNEETDVLEGSGYFENLETGETAEGYQGTFVFQNDRAQLVWTDAQIPEAQNGLTFAMYEPLLVNDPWMAEEADIFVTAMDGYYEMHIYTQPDFNEYDYLCTYDRATRTLTALDPSTIDFDSLSMELYRGIFTTTATFVLEDDGHLVWHDDTGVSGEGVVFQHMF